MCELLVGLDDVEIVGVEDRKGQPLRVHIRSRASRPACGGCGGPVWSKGVQPTELVDMPAFGRAVRLVWHKRRWRCPHGSCEVGSFTEQDTQIAPPRALLTTRAAKWATRRAGAGVSHSSTAAVLGCDWHTVNRSVRRWAQALLDADTARISRTTALGLDETLFCRRGRFRKRSWCTSIVDVASGKLLDVVVGRNARAPTRWLLQRSKSWRDNVRWAVLDLSGPYRSAYTVAVPRARQVADPFHVIRLANTALNETRRRVQNETLGHRGRKSDPLYRARKLLVSAHERITVAGDTKLRGLLEAGDPHGEVRDAWHAKETLRGAYGISDAKLAADTIDRLAQDLRDDPSLPAEINRLGGSLWRWRTQISNWFVARTTNGPTEAVNNLMKCVKRTAFGFTNFSNYRVRALLYAGKPDWSLLNTLTPP